MKNYRTKFIYWIIFITLFSCARIPVSEISSGKLRVGFDVDDTLLFSTPAFDNAKIKYQWDTDEFWREVNSLDSKVSIVKKKVMEIIKFHKSQNCEIFVITARPGIGGDNLKKFISEKFGIPEENTYFEPASKIERIKKLKLDIFYGDSDTDISDAEKGGAEGIRIQRSEKSSYKDSSGNLAKYNPGKFKEKIIENSAE
ncbi:hypothetical protein KA977_03220 [Candidatus Dependentiae bacterium]|nr:hypothetical protein [Candidatus Dependentiae bacterium]